MKRASEPVKSNPIAIQYQQRNRNRFGEESDLPNARDLPRVIKFIEDNLHVSMRSPEHRAEVYASYDVNNIADLYAKVQKLYKPQQ